MIDRACDDKGEVGPEAESKDKILAIAEYGTTTDEHSFRHPCRACGVENVGVSLWIALQSCHIAAYLIETLVGHVFFERTDHGMKVMECEICDKIGE